MPGSDTTELDTAGLNAGRPPRGEGNPRAGRLWRGVTGSLAAGLVILALAVFGAVVLGWVTGAVGPGLWPLLGHVAGAVAGVAAQRFADRHSGAKAAAAGVAVAGVAASVLWFFWWA
ncbi:hypothetical protein BAY61_04240 [Prauserella marina]|uniref:Uncharacterized protein n=1 Tax=Prauserella marina TaxID=530584 RepID=A0A222VKU8_9PSEU|nr:hypothetical protein [Prauserella marina]ASR34331.1 hypothetical protein BAY61_04240 [Prauserella marina]PWV71881.1 hypothetical protein DES30_11152 [Prauserella marina]SDD89944.1 hypothetical protein SAMN05421630_11451 [Prauserella marina]